MCELQSIYVKTPVATRVSSNGKRVEQEGNVDQELIYLIGTSL